MDVAMEVEDDLFFADLSKQISLLIMDDEDENSSTYRPSDSLQAVSQVIHPATRSTPYVYEQNYRRESKGTGVFIPRSSHNPSRKNGQGRQFSSNTKINGHTDKELNQVPIYNNHPPHNSLINPRRFS